MSFNLALTRETYPDYNSIPRGNTTCILMIEKLAVWKWDNLCLEKVIIPIII